MGVKYGLSHDVARLWHLHDARATKSRRPVHRVERAGQKSLRILRRRQAASGVQGWQHSGQYFLSSSC
eukprot:2608375-Amphidinium_carterae.2